MRRWLFALVLFFSLILWLLGTPGPVRAAAEPHGGGQGGGSGEVDIFKVATDLFIWTIVVFLLLLFILKKYAWKPMLEGLQQREQNILSALEEAQKAREEAQRIREQLQQELNKAHDKVREIIDEARRDAKRMHDDMVAEARTEIQGERDRLRREIQTAKDQAIQEILNQTSELATLVSAKAIQRQLDDTDQRRLVDEALAELSQQGEQWQRWA